MQRAALAILGTTLLLAACVTEGPVRPSPEPVYGNPDPYGNSIRQCIAANRRDQAEVYDLFDRARRDNRISPAESRDFALMDQRLRNYQQALGRDGLTLRECESIGREIAREREAVYRMARRDPALAQCRQDARQEHAEVVRMYQDADRAGRINPSERRQFSDMVERMRRHEAAMSRDGMTLGECRQLQALIADEREAVRRMSRHDPGVAQCRRDNQRAHADVMRMFADAERTGRISERERRRFDELQRRFRDYEATLKSDGLSLSDCQALGRTIASDAREVRRMTQDR
jgi:hypothetical protein